VRDWGHPSFQVTFDAGHPERIGRFWADVLGYIEQPPPEPPDARRATARAEADRLLALGARELRDADEAGEHWIVLQDPDGNEFCVQ
jgi:hypothetical protein